MMQDYLLCTDGSNAWSLIGMAGGASDARRRFRKSASLSRFVWFTCQVVIARWLKKRFVNHQSAVTGLHHQLTCGYLKYFSLKINTGQGSTELVWWRLLKTGIWPVTFRFLKALLSEIKDSWQFLQEFSKQKYPQGWVFILPAFYLNKDKVLMKCITPAKNSAVLTASVMWMYVMKLNQCLFAGCVLLRACY